MNYTFNIYEAEQIGLHEAIILSNIKFWIKRNIENEKHRHETEIDGKKEFRTFTYNSVKAFGKLFPFLTQKQIRTALENLRKKDILITGIFNKSPYDKTLWYALKEEKTLCPGGQIYLPSEANRLDPDGKPIPDVNTDIKYNTKYYNKSSKELLSGSEDNNKKNNQSPELNNKYIQYWNSKKNLRSHKPGTKLCERSEQIIQCIENGCFDKKYKIDPVYAAKNKINNEVLMKKITEKQIYETIDKFDWLCGPEGPGIKTGFPKSFDSFLFNNKTKTSFFYALLTKSFESLQILSSYVESKDPEIEKMYFNEFSCGLNNFEGTEIRKMVNFVVTQIEDFRKKIDPLPFPSAIRGKQIYRRHIEFINNKCNGKFNPGKFPWRITWPQFASWLKSMDDVDIMPSDSDIQKRKNKYFESHNIKHDTGRQC